MKVIGNDSDSLNMLSIGANEVWFQVVSRDPLQRALSDQDFGSSPETRSHGANHMRE